MDRVEECFDRFVRRSLRKDFDTISVDAGNFDQRRRSDFSMSLKMRWKFEGMYNNPVHVHEITVDALHYSLLI